MRHFISFFMLALSFSAAAQPVPKDVSELIAKFDQVMVKCPDKIWSNYDWGGKSVVMVYPSQNTSWVWDVDTNSTQALNNKDLPANVVGAYYTFFQWNGHPALSLNMEVIGDGAFEFGVHEFFHDQGQKGWVNNSTGRGTNYPAPWEPRVYRRLTYDHLVEYFKTGSQTELSLARFWYDKWTASSADEVANTTDGYEGTARYIEAMGLAIAKLSCQADETQLRAETLNTVLTNINFTHMFDGSSFELDAEGYAMGGLASLILRFEKPDLAQWNAVVAQGKTPLDILMDGITPQAEPMPMQLSADYAAAGKQINEERGKLLDQDIVNWTDNQFVRVALRFSWLQSNFMPFFFAHSKALNIDLFPFSQEHRMISPDRNSIYSVAANSVGFFDESSPCQEASAFALVRASDIQEKAGIMTVRSKTVNGTIKGRFQNQDGFAYLCVIE